MKVDANRSAINALGVQTAARFDRLEQRFDQFEHRFDQFEQRFGQFEQQVGIGFAEMRGRLDQTAAGMQRIVELLTPERRLACRPALGLTHLDHRGRLHTQEVVGR